MVVLGELISDGSVFPIREGCAGRGWVGCSLTDGLGPGGFTDVVSAGGPRLKVVDLLKPGGRGPPFRHGACCEAFRDSLGRSPVPPALGSCGVLAPSGKWRLVSPG